MKNLKNLSSDFFELTLPEQKDIIQSLHWEQLKSISEVAELLGTYNNKIRRWAQKNSFSLRDKSDAQKIALSTGKTVHPTKGKQRTEAEKTKIGNTVAEKWEGISDEERERRAEVSKKNWDKRSDREIEQMQEKATKGRLAAAKDGSKLEKIILSALVEKGYLTEFHKQHLLFNERVHLDIWLPKLRTAVEIDGPTHFEPIWGEENLKKTQKTDNIKDGLLLNSGYCIIRLRQKKNLSKTYVSKLKDDLFKILESIEIKFPEAGQRKITIGEQYA
jgi:very-short-patch-repair endonuclease